MDRLSDNITSCVAHRSQNNSGLSLFCFAILFCMDLIAATRAEGGLVIRPHTIETFQTYPILILSLFWENIC